MKVLMVGGNGYYAGMISAYLAEEFDLTVFDRQKEGPSFPCRYIRGDIMNSRSLRKAVEGQDSLICLFMGDAEASTVGMANILAAALEAEIPHVVYTSSGGMTYPIPFLSATRIRHAAGMDRAFWDSYFPVTEARGLFPGLETSSYFLCKWLCEQLGAHFCARGLKFTSLRPGNFMHDDMTCREAEAAKVVDPTHLLMNGHVTVGDSALMYRLAVLNPPESFAVYNLSNDTAYSVLSTEEARKTLGYRCADPDIYLGFYRKQDWRGAYRALMDKGIPESALRRLHAFRYQ
jgi:nucleoside-diphosphate-sugar epimerase